MTAIALIGVGLALPSQASDKASESIPDFVPSGSEEVAPGVYRTGYSVIDGEVATGFMFVDERSKAGPPEHANKDKDEGGGGGDSKCYSYTFGKNVKWTSTEDYTVADSADDEVTPGFFADNMAKDTNKWEASDSASFNIFGSNTGAPVDGIDTNNPDEKNEALFKQIGDTSGGTIAYTQVWAVTRGPDKKIIEWDMAFDTDWDWNANDGDNADGVSGEMDFESVATHELGHAIGMGHTDCELQTMYPTTSTGETHDRTLEQGDKNGASKLY